LNCGWDRAKDTRAGTTEHSRDTRLNLAEVGRVAPKEITAPIQTIVMVVLKNPLNKTTIKFSIFAFHKPKKSYNNSKPFLMQNLQNELIALLEKQENLVVEGKLNKNIIVEKALQLDSELLQLLLQNKTFKKHFFTDVKGVMVFDKIKFQRFVSNKAFLPDSYTAFKNKIGLTINDGSTDNYLSTRNDVVLSWAYKDCILEGGQTKEDQKRNEIFWNETLAPDQIDRLLDTKALTNFKKYDSEGEHEVTEITGNENLILKGNNLLCLSSLLKTHRGKIKLIYIDPPYNTGKDGFQYNDTFTHSAWLTFMQNRLEIAKQLLSSDGCIWVNIDDRESHYLKVLLDGIFGRESFITNIVWQKKFAPQNDAKFFSDNHDHIFLYAKNKDSFKINQLERSAETIKRYKNQDNDPRGVWSSGDLTVKTYNADYDYEITTPSGKKISPPDGICWRVSKDKFNELVEDNRVWFGKDGGNVPRLKRFLSEVKSGTTPLSIWLHKEVGHNQEAKQHINSIMGSGAFGTPKPERLLQRIIHIGSNEGDTILDFFAGSGTTASVAHKMGRKFITTEQMDYVQTVTVPRLQKVIEGEQGGISEAVNWQGGGSFVYAELLPYNQTFIDQIAKANTKEKLLQVWETMRENAFLSYQFDRKTFDERLDAFKTAELDTMKQYLLETLDKNQLYLNLSEIEDSRFNVSETDIQLNKQFYKQQ